MTKTEALIEEQILRGKAEVALMHGMIADNEMRRLCGQFPMHQGESFTMLAQDLQKIADTIKELTNGHR